jgi:hypothetical protein
VGEERDILLPTAIDVVVRPDALDVGGETTGEHIPVLRRERREIPLDR